MNIKGTWPWHSPYFRDNDILRTHFEVRNAAIVGGTFWTGARGRKAESRRDPSIITESQWEEGLKDDITKNAEVFTLAREWIEVAIVVPLSDGWDYNIPEGAVANSCALPFALGAYMTVQWLLYGHDRDRDRIGQADRIRKAAQRHWYSADERDKSALAGRCDLFRDVTKMRSASEVKESPKREGKPKASSAGRGKGSARLGHLKSRNKRTSDLERAPIFGSSQDLKRSADTVEGAVVDSSEPLKKKCRTGQGQVARQDVIIGLAPSQKSRASRTSRKVALYEPSTRSIAIDTSTYIRRARRLGGANGNLDIPGADIDIDTVASGSDAVISPVFSVSNEQVAAGFNPQIVPERTSAVLPSKQHKVTQSDSETLPAGSVANRADVSGIMHNSNSVFRLPSSKRTPTIAVQISLESTPRFADPPNHRQISPITPYWIEMNATSNSEGKASRGVEDVGLITVFSDHAAPIQHARSFPTSPISARIPSSVLSTPSPRKRGKKRTFEVADESTTTLELSPKCQRRLSGKVAIKGAVTLHSPPKCQSRSSAECTAQMPVRSEAAPEASPSKLPLPCAPPVWAHSRQELCEALRYFKSYQGGVYFYKGLVYGYLLDGFPGPRDAWEHGGRVIISHGGGKAIADCNGKTQLADSQKSSDHRISALFHSMRTKQPIVLIVGSHYSLFPFELGCGYVVLGHYWITHAWAEPEPSSSQPGVFHNRYKFRFQYIAAEPQPVPWWHTVPETPAGWHPLTDQPLRGKKDQKKQTMPRLQNDHIPRRSPEPPLQKCGPSAAAEIHAPLVDANPKRRIPGGRMLKALEEDPVISEGPVYSSEHLDHSREAVAHHCALCGTKFPVIYTKGAFCMEPSCAAYWKFDDGLGDGLALMSGDLEYEPTFILPIYDPHKWTLHGIRPAHPVSQIRLTEGHCTSKEFWKGSHCVKCGRLSRRVKLTRWECAECGESIQPSPIAYTANDLKGTAPLRNPDKKMDQKEVTKLPNQAFTIGAVGYTVSVYHVPLARSKIYLIRPDPMVQGREAADELLERFQREAQDGNFFLRSPIHQHATRGSLLAQHFSFNSGEEYKYSADAGTVAFEDAPPSVRDARDMLCRRVASVLDKDPGFNELLSIAYMDGQCINYHDDGEEGLGPVVASLSLGAPAVMSFRRKTKAGPRNKFRQKAPTQEKDKASPQADGDTIAREDENTTPMNDKGKSSKEGKKKARKACLVLNLAHGDVLVMDGRELHELYEHMVEPKGFRIACTGRQIGTT